MRPLGLETDPAPAMSLARLIGNNNGGLQHLNSLYDKTANELKTELSKYRYELVDGEIRSLTGAGSTSWTKPNRLKGNGYYRLCRGRNKNHSAA